MVKTVFFGQKDNTLAAVSVADGNPIGVPEFCPSNFFSKSMDYYISFEKTFQDLSNEPIIKMKKIFF